MERGRHARLVYHHSLIERSTMREFVEVRIPMVNYQTGDSLTVAIRSPQ
ncbi:hypothetical protein NJ7G_2046 [Natrinema sp. J7-2]|nr:hypothetical protein NJ7G_2046 [Natrinema sp. J7-2]